MPTTQQKMDRKKLLQKYRDGTLSEKTKKAFNFPPGPVQLDFEPLWDEDEIKAVVAKAAKPAPPAPKAEEGE